MKSKIYYISTCLLMLFVILSHSIQAQTRQEKMKAGLKRLIESKDYVFLAESATPLSGSLIRLTSIYFLKINKDSLDSHLPYFGVAFRAPMGTTESPLSFTSTDFDYSMKESKKAGFQIKIRINKPSDPDLMMLSVSSSGYATLTVNSMHRQSISFYGELVSREFLEKK
ncbi:DUF4251 domain-containing protein [Daejeonella sp.]|jgi:hypothetical protein|uniref:DUF4251 domain-containing protein n=1 Tax=Daejeonella sp. TaxID=2805397 RepID=UPI0037C11851